MSKFDIILKSELYSAKMDNFSVDKKKQNSFLQPHSTKTFSSSRYRNYETPAREAISLQEKSPVPPDVQQTDLQQQPLPPIRLLTVVTAAWTQRPRRLEHPVHPAPVTLWWPIPFRELFVSTATNMPTSGRHHYQIQRDEDIPSSSHPGHYTQHADLKSRRILLEKTLFIRAQDTLHLWVMVCQEVLNLMATIITCVQKPTGLCLDRRLPHLRNTLPEVERVPSVLLMLLQLELLSVECMVRPPRGLLSRWRRQPPASAVVLPAQAEGWPAVWCATFPQTSVTEDPGTQPWRGSLDTAITTPPLPLCDIVD